jgi:predicted ATP-grasp superfamily ATP-dependent carboligase
LGCERVLISGVSTRAAAESAARAGFAVTALDAYGDLDQHPGVRALSLHRDLGRRFTATAAARAARDVECDAVAYLSPFENHPRALDLLARGRTLWGNPAGVLRRVRNPLLLARALRAHGLATLAIHTSHAADPNRSSWLLKPLKSGGGHRIVPWLGGRWPPGSYLQERASGPAGSFLFVAANGRVAPLGISRQLIGEQAFGATGYRYCGNIVAAPEDLRLPRPEALADTLCAIASVVAVEFGLVGVNGIDFIAHDGVPFVLEVNPRWSGAMELLERWSGVSVFGAHATACTGGSLTPASRAPAGTGAVGKAIVFARSDVVVNDAQSWLSRDDIRDVPHPHERIGAGQPVCTVFARGRSVEECRAGLVRRAETVYEELEMRNVS